MIERLVRSLFVPVGILAVAPWLVWSVGIISDNAPDMPVEWAAIMLVAQVVLLVAFVANWWRWRPGAPILLAAVVGYAAAAAGAAANNNGIPWLAAVLLVGPPALAATPLVAHMITGRGAGDPQASTP